MEVVMTYLQNDVFRKKKGINVEVFNMIKNKNEAKTSVKPWRYDGEGDTTLFSFWHLYLLELISLFIY